jgi:hypothetical protein
MEAILIHLLFTRALQLRKAASSANEASDKNKRNAEGRLSNLASSDLLNVTAIAEFWIVGERTKVPH